MHTLNIRLPDSLHKRLIELAWKEGDSMNQLITLVVPEKLSALMTADYLQERAAKGDQRAFANILAKVPDIEPVDMDRL
jgi:hypothetical protein